MARIVLIFASMSGNTEMMADAIADGVKEMGEKIKIIDAFEGPDASVLEQYDGILLGGYTWGDGDLPDELVDFVDAMSAIDLSGKKAAAFGSGDSLYTHFAGAVDLLMEKLSDCGADVYPQALKVELTPEKEEIEACRMYGKQFVSFLNTTTN